MSQRKIERRPRNSSKLQKATISRPKKMKKVPKKKSKALKMTYILLKTLLIKKQRLLMNKNLKKPRR